VEDLVQVHDRSRREGRTGREGGREGGLALTRYLVIKLNTQAEIMQYMANVLLEIQDDNDGGCLVLSVCVAPFLPPSLSRISPLSFLPPSFPPSLPPSLLSGPPQVWQQGQVHEAGCRRAPHHQQGPGCCSLPAHPPPQHQGTSLPSLPPGPRQNTYLPSLPSSLPPSLPPSGASSYLRRRRHTGQLPQALQEAARRLKKSRGEGGRERGREGRKAAFFHSGEGRNTMKKTK